MASANVKQITDSNFESDVLKSGQTVLVQFTAAWCGPCKALTPIVEKVADEFAGKITVGKLDIDENPAMAGKYGVRSIPTLLVFKGGEKTGSNVGLTNRDTIVKLLGV